MRAFLRLLAPFAAIAFAAGCSGALTPSPAVGLSTAAAPAARAAQSVRVTMAIPKRSRRPRYISPATQSMKIAILKGRKTVFHETVNLTTSSPGCTSTLARTLCIVTILIGPGRYTASLTTYDALNGTGNALSTAQGFAFTVKAGEDNTIALTLDGIPAQITVMSAGADSVYALAQDADGNFIVGAGAPSFTASNTSGPAVAAIVQPAASEPNLITVAQAIPAVSGFETIGLTASYPKKDNACTEPGAVCYASSAITASYETQLLVANYGGSNVSGFAVPLASATQSPDVDVSIPYANRLVADPNGHVFVTSFTTSGSLWEIAPPYASATLLNAQGVVEPHGIALDAGDNVYVADTYGGSISVYDAPYTSAPAVITNGIDLPNSLVIDSGGTLYSANAGSSTVTAYAPPAFSATPVSVATASDPLFLTVAHGTLFVGEGSAVELFSLPLANGETPSMALSSGISTVNAMALDSSGNLYVANNAGGADGVGSIEEFTSPLSSGESPAATVAYSDAMSGFYDPFSLAVGPGGYLYVVDNYGGGSGAGGIEEYALPLTTAAKPLVSLQTQAFSTPYGQTFGAPIYAVTP